MTEHAGGENLRILFIGARVVGYRCLEALAAGGFRPVGVLELSETKRAVTTAFQSFEPLVQRYGLQRRHFESLKTPDAAEWAEELKPDLGIVVGVSQLVGPEVLRVPPHGFLGLHPTLLPQGRGRAPIPWAIIKGLSKTGVTWFVCEEGADTGDIVAQREVPVYYEDNCSTLGSRTDDVATELLVDAVSKIAAGAADRIPQDDSRATVWGRRRPRDGIIDWSRTGRELYDWVRALTHPYPGAFTTLGERRLWVWQARETRDERGGRPGEVLAVLPHGVLVGTGDGALLLQRLQWEGEDEVEASEAGLSAGDMLGT